MKLLNKSGKSLVLHIGQDTGGIRTYLGHVFENSINPDFEYMVVAPKNDAFENYCKNKSINYYQVNLLRGAGLFTTISSLFSLIKIIRKKKPDIIHTHSAMGGFLGRLAARLTGVNNVIYTPHAYSYLSFTGLKRIFFYSLEILAIRWTSILLAISYSEKQKSIFELGYNKNNVKLILNSIPVYPLLINPEVKKSFKIRMIGRLTIQKNPMLFLEIAKEICKKHEFVEFSILGAGIHDELAPDLFAFINENSLADKIKIEQWLNESETKKYLQETDIYLVTSIFEGLSYSLLEAMSLGKACVVSAVDGNTDVILNNENGFTCLSKEDFCDKIELLIRNNELRKSIGLAAYNYVLLNHNINDAIIELENLYIKLISDPVKVGKRAKVDNVISINRAN